MGYPWRERLAGLGRELACRPVRSAGWPSPEPATDGPGWSVRRLSVLASTIGRSKENGRRLGRAELHGTTDHFRGAVVTWNGVRRDQEILDHLSASSVPLFDMNTVHQREYEQASGSYHEYMSRYMVGGDGHYNPRGNHFFAYELKDRLLELLDPKPLPYQDRGPDTVDLSEYLPAT